METQIAEIAPNIYRLSTYVEDADFMFNQFLVVDEEPVLFQTGLRAIFPLVENAVARLIPIEQHAANRGAVAVAVGLEGLGLGDGYEVRYPRIPAGTPGAITR